MRRRRLVFWDEANRNERLGLTVNICSGDIEFDHEKSAKKNRNQFLEKLNFLFQKTIVTNCGFSVLTICFSKFRKLFLNKREPEEGLPYFYQFPNLFLFRVKYCQIAKTI